MAKLTQIEGIGAKYAQALQTAGIDNQADLLAACASRSAREKLARDTGINHKLIMKWANQADLVRINGIGEEYAELLERTGVDTVPELAQRNAQSLHTMLVATNERLKLVRHVPGLSQVDSWVKQAADLPHVLNY